jgi:hypothetical protein
MKNEKAEHLYLNIDYLFKDMDLKRAIPMIVSKSRNKQIPMKIEHLALATLCGGTGGISHSMSFPQMKQRETYEKPYISLQTAGYQSCRLEKGEFPKFKLMDKKAKEFYEKKQQEIADIKQEIQDYFKKRFNELPPTLLVDVMDIVDKADSDLKRIDEQKAKIDKILLELEENET